MGDALPAEVIFKILSHTAPTDVNTLMRMNRRWYTLSQQQLYKEVTITVEETDPIVHAILHSNSKPGRFVSKMNFHSLAVPKNFTVSALDTIDLLTIQCPRVTEIQFNHELDVDEWNYFEASLRSQYNVWKLENIIYPFSFSDSAWAHYKRCAVTMMHSLKHFYIGAKTLKTVRESDLFQSLTCVTVNPGLMQSLMECGDILRSMSKLEKMHTTLKNQKTDAQLLSCWGKRDVYPTIRTLHLTYDGVITVEDLHIIMYKFRALEDLQLKFNGGIELIRDELFRGVIQYITSLRRYHLEICNLFQINDCVLLLEKYYMAVNNEVISGVVDIYYESNTKRSICCSLHDQSKNINLTFVTHSSRYEDMWYVGYVTSKILTDEKISMNFKTLHFHLKGDMLNPYVLQNIHRLNYTKKLIFTRGRITAGSLHGLRYSLSVGAIELNECYVSAVGCLYHFLSYFHHVSLKLTHCRLPVLNEQGELHLSLPTSVTDTLHLNFASPVYARIKFIEKDDLYFFFDDFSNTAHNISQSIDSEIYKQHLRM
ncbi:hypothetical protein INT47_003662 [Mucor saturninus]|uniref:F-box domain-containing protein n=1 Tax=Mucor saturninus TaxID=64648 RepID=A0A8H7V4C7_9FUNG|nr:hypothetical protein INT47_003662 [Mucor saturninus]